MDWLKYMILGGITIGIVAVAGENLSTEVLLALILGATGVGVVYFLSHSPIGEAVAERIRSRTEQSLAAANQKNADGDSDIGQLLLRKIKEDLFSKTDEWISSMERKKIESDFPEGIIAIMFTDMENFTGLIERGDEEAYRLLKRHNQVISESAKQWNGRVVKSYGDGFMVAFPSARRAVYAALSIQKILDNQNGRLPGADQIHVRIGIDAGEPTKEGDDYIGRAVNRAARIAALADGCQVFVSETVRQLVGPIQNLQYVDLGNRSLKGFKEPHHIYEISRIEALTYPLDSEIDRGIAELEERVNRDR